jgi:NAD(P)-dependent dehydrogenase (short-subunit alcohol dehydrogenase family)
MSAVKSAPADPKEAGPQPPFPARPQEPPGTETALTPDADHGEKSYKGSGKLTGKAALITGADSGIGRAAALAFAREGADVLISYLDEEDDAAETERLITAAGRKAVRVPGDIRDESHCTQLIEQAFVRFGRLDVLVNNAAYQMSQQSIEDITTEQFDRVMHTNLYAMFFLCRAALPRMKPGACIINTSSIQGYDPSPQLLDYAATKCAIIGFTKALAKQAMGRGVRVNAVAPGPVWTPLIPSTMPKEKVAQFGKDTVFGRPAQPAELAPLFVWLASPEAAYVTGEVYGATGGQSPY